MSRKKKPQVTDELDVESIAFEGGGVAKKDSMVYFIKDAVPGDKIKARLTKKKKTYAHGEIEELIKASGDRTEPKCIHFGLCGGCKWQQLSYEKQLFWKKQHVIDSFSRIGKINDCHYHDTMPSPKDYFYRNKMEFSFSGFRWLTEQEINSGDDILDKDFALGLHVPGVFNKVLDIKECYLHQNVTPKILDHIRNKAKQMGVSPYDVKTHEGFLRNLVFRSSEHKNELMVILITTSVKEKEDEYFLNWYKEDLPAAFGEITHLLHATNDSFSPVAQGETGIIKGDDHLTEKIMDVEFRISPFSFFQTNSFQLDRFVKKILEFARIEKNETVWDLYCGTGSISLPASRYAHEVIGMEIVESSIEDAIKNQELNGIKNTRYICTDLHSKTAPKLLEDLPEPNVMIIDPPRAGMHKNLIPAVLEAEPERIIYVSCNPATQARDCEMLSDKYLVEEVQPVDMFPQTYHVESIAKLIRKR